MVAIMKPAGLLQTKKVILLLSLFMWNVHNCFSQFKKAEIGIAGLTCSLCSMGVEKSLLKSVCVSKVQMDLNNNLAEVFFKGDQCVNIGDLANKVESAGFSVTALEAEYNFKEVTVGEGTSFIVSDATYLFVGVQNQILNGVKKIKFVGKNFMEKSEYAKWKSRISEKQVVSLKGPVYLVTL